MKKILLVIFSFLFVFLFGEITCSANSIIGPGGESSEVKPTDIVAEISIYSAIQNGSGSSSSSSFGSALIDEMTGLHSYIVLKNISTIDYTISGYILNPNSYVTFGTWNDSKQPGVWINRERVFYSDNSQFDCAFIKKTISMYQVANLSNLIFENDEWTLEKNCSTFATNIWYSLFNDSLDAYNSVLRYNTPKKLYFSILEKNNAKTKIDYPSCQKYGYLDSNKNYIIYN